MEKQDTSKTEISDLDADFEAPFLSRQATESGITEACPNPMLDGLFFNRGLEQRIIYRHPHPQAMKDNCSAEQYTLPRAISIAVRAKLPSRQALVCKPHSNDLQTS